MKRIFTWFFLLWTFLLVSVRSHAQLNYLPGGFTTAAGTYTDLGSNGTVISVTNMDDGFSTALPIGFTFNFNGAPYDSFVFSTNGFIKLGSDTPSRHFLFTSHAQPPPNGPFTSTTSPTPLAKDTSMIFAFGQDLWPGTLASEYRYYTSGSFGSRVCTIQWKNVKDKLQATIAGEWDTINFQVKLYESTNVIEIQYGKWTSSTAVNFARFSAVGIVGNSMTTSAQNLHLVKGSTVVWSGAVANTGFYLNNAVNYRTPTSSPAGPAPDLGRTYTFTPITLNDAAVRAIYAQGRVAKPFYAPDSIRANILNVGVNAITGLTVTLNITGANTYTDVAYISYLAPNGNANVAFAPYMPLNNGNNLITVSVPTDDNNANNSKTHGYSVGNNRFAYTDTTTLSSGGNGTTIPNFWGARYFVAGTGMVTKVRSPLASNSDAVGDTVCGIVMDSTGKILARSASYIVQTSDLGTTLIFNMTMPAVVTNQSVICGIAGGQTINGLNYFLGTSQTEVPIRPNAAFYFMSQTLAGGLTGAVVGATYANPVLWGTTRLMMECDVEPLPPNDVGVSAASPNANLRVPAGLAVPLRAIVKNTGTASQGSGIAVRYRVNGGTVVGPVNTGVSIAPGDTTSVVFSGTNALTLPTAGNYTIQIYTSLGTDGLRGNDTLTMTLTAVANNSLPYRISGGLLSAWTSSGNTPALWKEKSCLLPNGNTGTTVLYADNNITSPGREAWMYSPPLNLTGATNPILHFYVAHAPNTFTGTDDTLQVMISTDGGFSFTPLYTRSSLLSALPLGTDTPTSFSYTPAYVTDWRHEGVSLNGYGGNPYVIVAFRNRCASGNSIYIADVTVTNAQSVSVQNVSSTGMYGAGNLSFLFSSVGNTNGDLTIARYSGNPFSTASPVFATNTAATTNNSSIFTPTNASQTHWYTVTYSGSGTGYYTTTIQYSVNFSLAGVPGIQSTDSLYLMKRSDYTGSWQAISSNISAGNLYTGLLNGFSDYTLGSMPAVNTLPVSWLSINARQLSTTANQVRWVTAWEKNCIYFEVEYSTDGEHFTAATRLDATNTSRPHEYSFVHNLGTEWEGDMYYRIRQEDADGKVSFSKTIRLSNAEVASQPVFKTGNPFTGELVVQVEGLSKATGYTLVLTDLQGKEVLRESFEVDAGSSRLSVTDGSRLRNGYYLLRIENNEEPVYTEKLLKMN